MSWLGAPTPTPAASAAAATFSSSLRHRPRGHGGGDARTPSGSGSAGPSSSAPAAASTPSARPRSRRKPKGSANGASSPHSGSLNARGWVQAAFKQFGEHCARNQIRTLLIDCLVMTNLFYPSFAMFVERHFTNANHGVQQARAPGAAPIYGSGSCGEEPVHCTPCWLFSGGLGETFYPPPPPLLPNVEWGPWWAAEGGPAAGDAQWVPAPAGQSCSDASVELVRVAWADVGDVLDAEHEAEWTTRDDQVVSAVRSLAEGWDNDVGGSEAARCVRHLVNRDGVARPDGACYLISPHDAARVPGSTDLQALWGRSRTSPSPPQEQIYRGLIVPFHKPKNSTAFESAWTHKLAQVMAPFGAEVFSETYAGGKTVPCSTVVSFSTEPPEPAPEPISSAPPHFVLALYGVLLVILLYQLSSATKVHSRFGLAFTGIVQLCCSTVMSFSVLALLGWNGWGRSTGQTVLPTYTLPFVIVVVGAENMSALTKAVFSVPFTYSVPVRIGIGLGKVGSTIALTSLTDLALLGLVWLCVHLQPVREFCVFAAVVIVTDWFMLHTFFLTVLSIDAQRLELADVLVSNGGLSSAEAQKREEDKEKRRASRKATRFSWRSVLRARTAKSGSLLLLLTSLVVLYYYTEPGRAKFRTSATLYGYKPTSTSSLAPSARPSMFATSAADLPFLSQSESLWRSLNPQGLSSVRITQPPSSIVVFPRVGHSLLPADIRKLSLPVKTFKLPRLEPLWYWVKMGLLPQAATSFALYGLLLYLLKDSDLLDAQRNRLGRGREPHGSDEETDDGGHPKTTSTTKSSVTTGVGVHMLPASHESDVDVIAASVDGRLAISIGVDNSVCLWRFTDEDRVSGTREMVATAFIPPGDPIVAAAVSSDCQYAAIATRGGVVQLWSTPDDDRKTEALGPVMVCSEGVRVVTIAFDDSPSSAEDPFTASPTGRGPQGRPSLLVATSDGAIQAIAPGNRVMDIAPPATNEKGVFCRVDILSTNTGPLAIVSGPSRMMMWRKEQGEWSCSPLMSNCDPVDRVTAVAAGYVDWQRPTDVVAIGRRSGRIEVFDADGECVSGEFGQEGEPVRFLGVSSPATTKCSTCDSRSTDGFFVVSSTSDHVFVDRILPRRADAFCRCPPPPRRSSAMDDVFGRAASSPVVLPPSPARARAAAGVFSRSVTASPIKGGALAPPSNGEFPLSSHGARRLSGWRESSEIPRPPSPLDRTGSYTALSTLSMSAPDDSTLSSPGRAWDDAEVVPLGAVVATDGGWEILDNHVVGIRRAGAGIDDSQWQLWAIDLCAPWNGTSLLVDAAGLDVLERRTRAATAPRAGELKPPSPTDGEMPMRARRAERILSLNGRASFPSSVGSFTVPTHLPLGYVAVRPFRVAGARTLLAGFGNRVGVVTLPTPPKGRAVVPALNLPPRPTLAFNGAANPAPRIVTPRRTGFPAPPPPRKSDTGTANGSANGSAPSNGSGTGGLLPSPPKT